MAKNSFFSRSSQRAASLSQHSASSSIHHIHLFLPACPVQSRGGCHGGGIVFTARLCSSALPPHRHSEHLHVRPAFWLCTYLPGRELCYVDSASCFTSPLITLILNTNTLLQHNSNQYETHYSYSTILIFTSECIFVSSCKTEWNCR